MQSLYFRLIVIITISIFIACDNASGPSTEQQPTAPAESSSGSLDQVYLPSITVEEIQTLWTNTNQIDYLFYELPISSSISDSPSAQAHLRHISDTPVNQTTKSNCPKGLGRAFYKTNGEDLIEAEIFFSEQCAFFVFYKNGKASYSNLMTPDGVSFYNQMIAAVKNAQMPPNG